MITCFDQSHLSGGVFLGTEKLRLQGSGSFQYSTGHHECICDLKKLTAMMQETLKKQDGRLIVVWIWATGRAFIARWMRQVTPAGAAVELDAKEDKRDLRSDGSEPYRTGDRNASTVGKPVA
jgi:hypothetical protein